jgi:serine/threonine protein kinase/WD40 repeat protein
VALKVIKPGMDTRDVIARFEAERQALALMDHPHIAKVFDAGATPSGRPYFVMELIKGVPITDYCDQIQLTPRERLGLFVSVCQAVQHAHTKGVIHRDLKPSNVLVTLHDDTPMVKVIDFGVAKAMGQHLTEKTIYTRFNQMIGTPLYMSPEQAQMSALDVDTRTDVYALGVLLYELLTGTTPFDPERFSKAALDEVCRIIREEEPPKPSTRLTTLGETLSAVSAKRKTEPRKLSALVRGDLDWVVMKALEKDRTRRYETASAFAADVGRYLNEQPVEASPPSSGYRLRKFVRRHQGPALAVTLLMAVLTAGMVGTTVGLVRALQAEADAKNLQRIADENRQREVLANEKTKDQLCRSKVDQAQSQLASTMSGRRWKALELLQEAEQLRIRPRPDGADASGLPTRAEIRRLAAMALLTPDCRIIRESPHDFLIMTPDCAWGIVADGDPLKLWRVRVADMQRRLLTDGKQPILRRRDIALSHNGRLFATSDAHGLTIRDLDADKEVHWPPQQTKTPNGEMIDLVTTHLVFLPESTKVLGICRGQQATQIRVWDFKTGEPPLLLVNECESIPPHSPLLIDRAGRHIAYGTRHGIVLCDIQLNTKDCDIRLTNNKLLGAPNTGREQPVCADFSPDGSQLAVVGWSTDESLDFRTKDATITVWNVDDRTRVAELTTDPMIYAIAWHPRANQLAVANLAGLMILRLPDGRQLSQIRLFPIGGPPDDLGLFRWSNDGHLIFWNGGSLTTLEVDWDRPEADIATGREIPSTFAFSPDLDWLAIGLQGRSKPVWIMNRKEGIIKQLPIPNMEVQYFSQVRWLRFSPDSRRLGVLGINTLPAVVFDTKDWSPIPCKPVFALWPDAAFDQEGQLIVASYGNVVNAMTGQSKFSFHGRGIEFGRIKGRLVLIDHVSERYLPQFREKRAALYIRAYDGEAPKLNEWQEPEHWRLHFPYVLSPDGRWLAAGTTKQKFAAPWGAQLFSTAPAQPIFLPTADVVKCIAFNPDSDLVALGCFDGTIHLFRLPAGEELLQWKPTTRTGQEFDRWYPRPIKEPDLMFTPDGNALVWCDAQNPNLKVLELGKLKLRLAEVGLTW